MKKLLSLFIINVCLTGCGVFDGGSFDESQPAVTMYAEPEPYPVIVDGAEITSSPQRIISLSPALTEIVCEFGYAHRVVGRSEYCDYPIGVGAIPAIPSGSRFDVEQIIPVSPDLLLLSAPISDRDKAALTRAGIATVVIPAPRNIAEFREIYNLIGVIMYGAFTGESRGESAFSGITRACNNPRVVNIGNFIYITENMATATGDTLESAILSCFGTNLAEEGRGYLFDLETLIHNGPDTVLVNDNISLSEISSHPVYGRLEAVEEGRVIFLENGRFERPTMRIVDLISVLIIQYEFF